MATAGNTSVILLLDPPFRWRLTCWMREPRITLFRAYFISREAGIHRPRDGNEWNCDVI